LSKINDSVIFELLQVWIQISSGQFIVESEEKENVFKLEIKIMQILNLLIIQDNFQNSYEQFSNVVQGINESISKM
jgi:ribosomal protein S9